jgi:hypothetical protein
VANPADITAAREAADRHEAVARQRAAIEEECRKELTSAHRTQLATLRRELEAAADQQKTLSARHAAELRTQQRAYDAATEAHVQAVQTIEDRHRGEMEQLQRTCAAQLDDAAEVAKHMATTLSPVAAAVAQVRLASTANTVPMTTAVAVAAGATLPALATVLPSPLQDAMAVVERFAAHASECATPRLMALLSTAAAASASVADAQEAIRAVREPGDALDAAVAARDAAKAAWVEAVETLSNQQSGTLGAWLSRRSHALSTTLLPAAVGVRAAIPSAPGLVAVAVNATMKPQPPNCPHLPASATAIASAVAACSGASSATEAWLQTQTEAAATARAATTMAATAAAAELETAAQMLRSPATAMVTATEEGAVLTAVVAAGLNSALNTATVAARDEVGARLAAESAAGSFESVVRPVATAIDAVVTSFEVCGRHRPCDVACNVALDVACKLACCIVLTLACETVVCAFAPDMNVTHSMACGLDCNPVGF